MDDIFTENQSSGHLLNSLANDKMKKVFLFELKQANWNQNRYFYWENWLSNKKKKII